MCFKEARFSPRDYELGWAEFSNSVGHDHRVGQKNWLDILVGQLAPRASPPIMGPLMGPLMGPQSQWVPFPWSLGAKGRSTGRVHIAATGTPLVALVAERAVKLVGVA